MFCITFSCLLPRRFVKNLSRREEGFMAAASLQQILADNSHGHNSRLGGKIKKKQPMKWHILLTPASILLPNFCIYLF